MRRLLNKLLARFGYLIVKAPALSRSELTPTDIPLPDSLTEPVSLRSPDTKPTGELAELFYSLPNVHKWYHYFDVYEHHFARFRDRPIRMLEIGVFRGGSLHMWKRFFHPESTIVGIDIDPSCAVHDAADHDIHVRIGSQADPDFLESVNEEFGPFDIILDDGSHRTHHQITSFGALFRSALKENGCYFVEDCHGNYWLKHIDSTFTFMDLAKYLVDVLHEPYLDRAETHFRKGHGSQIKQAEVSYLSANLDGIHFYDSIVVFEKKRRDLPLNELRPGSGAQ